MQQIGYSLIDDGGAEIQFWGDVAGQSIGLPSMVKLPNGNDVHCPEAGVSYGGFRIVPRMLQEGASSIEFDGTQVIVTRPAPAIIGKVESYGVARFKVASGVVTTTPDSVGAASILRVSAGRYRVYHVEADPDLRLIPRGPAVMDAADRRARLSAQTPNYVEIRVVDGAGNPADAAAVTLWFDKVQTQ